MQQLIRRIFYMFFRVSDLFFRIVFAMEIEKKCCLYFCVVLLPENRTVYYVVTVINSIPLMMSSNIFKH